jgi:hypothetical protein
VQHQGIGRRLRPAVSGSTPHDRLSIPQICAPRSPSLDGPRQTALGFPAGSSNRSTVNRRRQDPPLLHRPLHGQTTRCIGSTQISQLARGTQIPIARHGRTFPSRGFLPWRLSDAGRPSSRCRPSCGRHPKPFTPAAFPNVRATAGVASTAAYCYSSIFWQPWAPFRPSRTGANSPRSPGAHNRSASWEGPTTQDGPAH